MKDIFLWILVIILSPLWLIDYWLSPRCPRCGSKDKALEPNLRLPWQTDTCFHCLYSWDRLYEKWMK